LRLALVSSGKGNAAFERKLRTLLALPARTDVAIRPGERENLEMIPEHMLHHPERRRFQLATPV
jgi:hypothetical protein